MDETRKRVAVLGSTGSIGRNTLEIVDSMPDRFDVVGLSANRNAALLAQQIDRYRPKLAGVADRASFEEVAALTSYSETTVLAGPEGLCQVAACPEADIVVAAVVGAAGFDPLFAAVDAGKDVALANKEPLVMAGSLVMPLAEERGVTILPVDSEHSAIFQCLRGNEHKHVRRIILTASGGPFYNYGPDQLRTVTPDQAVAHPNWSMGKKVSVDSATLMNKGLEIIEAMWLFGMDADSIDVLIHHQSIIHSMVEYVDGAVLAQLSVPDMKLPIQYALTFPDRAPNVLEPLDLAAIGTLSFESPDVVRFPCLGLAREAARLGGTMPAVLSAANEVAVEQFLAGRVSFPDIPRTIESVMAGHQNIAAPGLDEIKDADLWAREKAEEFIAQECVND